VVAFVLRNDIIKYLITNQLSERIGLAIELDRVEQDGGSLTLHNLRILAKRTVDGAPALEGVDPNSPLLSAKALNGKLDADALGKLRFHVNLSAVEPTLTLVRFADGRMNYDGDQVDDVPVALTPATMEAELVRDEFGNPVLLEDENGVLSYVWRDPYTG